MNMKDVREMAKRYGLKIGNLKKTEAIRSIQLAEGNTDCYGRANGQCDQEQCCFRQDCLAMVSA